MVVFPLLVQSFQIFSALDVTERQHFRQALQLLLEIIPLAVQDVKKRINGVEIGPEPRVEMAQVFLSYLRLELIQDAIEQGM